MKRVYVIGYIGSNRRAAAEKLAAERGWPLMDLDREIERLDGKTVEKLIIVGGEHHYRNAEFEIISRLTDPEYPRGYAKNVIYPEELVILCGDSVVLDEDSRAMLAASETVFVEEDLDTVFDRIKDEKLHFGFMRYGTEDEKRKAYKETYERRLPLYMEACSGNIIRG